MTKDAPAVGVLTGGVHKTSLHNVTCHLSIVARHLGASDNSTLFTTAIAVSLGVRSFYVASALACILLGILSIVLGILLNVAQFL